MVHCHRRKRQWRDEDLDAVRQARQILADATADLRFDDKQHRYFLGERELSSVSSVVESYSTFDEYEKALGCSRNIRHEHYGKSPEEIEAIGAYKQVPVPSYRALIEYALQCNPPAALLKNKH